MVEIQVAVADATVAQGLLRRLAGLIDRSAVAFDDVRKEVRVRSEWDSRDIRPGHRDGRILAHGRGVDSARLLIGDRSYTMVNPAHTASLPENVGRRARFATSRPRACSTRRGSRPSGP